MKTIQLTRGKFALVDDDDFDRLTQRKWQAKWSRKSGSFYASATIQKKGKKYFVMMSRVITGAMPDEVVDHINHDTLDNRKVNLRLCTARQSCCNRRTFKNSKTGFSGVHEYGHGKYQFRVYLGGKYFQVVGFDTPEEAALARDMVAVKVHGQFAHLNFQR